MPTHATKLTDSEARKIAPPPSSYALHWCPRTPGFGLRVTANGARAWISERRVDGKTVRRTLGSAAGRGAISGEAARALQIDVSSELQKGVDRLEIKRERRAAEKVEGLTFGDALRDYVKAKRRAKDGLPLKQRTKDDYLAMIEPGRAKKDGSPTLDGELYALAGTSLGRLDADAIRRVHKALEPRGERRQSYAMQVLRAVLRHEGVNIDGNPLSASTAGKNRVKIAPPRGDPAPIPPERLAAWWRAASDVTTVSGESLRFALLTGCRPGEVAAITGADVNLRSGRVTLVDTKNRKNHDVLLSDEALKIIERCATGKGANVPVFGVADSGKTLATINAKAGTPDISQHQLRHTFASIAEGLVSGALLKKMLNHSVGGDVTLGHYVKKSEAQLRAGWQTVSDYITNAE